MSIRFQADADLNFAIVAAVRKREPAIDIASATEARLEGVTDDAVLDRAAKEERNLVSHDRRTMLSWFRDRLAAGESSPGLLIVSQGSAIGAVVEAIVLIWATADPLELRNQVLHLPSLARHEFVR